MAARKLFPALPVLFLIAFDCFHVTRGHIDRPGIPYALERDCPGAGRKLNSAGDYRDRYAVGGNSGDMQEPWQMKNEMMRLESGIEFRMNLQPCLRTGNGMELKAYLAEVSRSVLD